MNPTHRILPLLLGALLAPSVPAADGVTATIHSDRVTGQIDEKIYGQFLEHIYHSVNGGFHPAQVVGGGAGTHAMT